MFPDFLGFRSLLGFHVTVTASLSPDGLQLVIRVKPLASLNCFGFLSQDFAFLCYVGFCPHVICPGCRVPSQFFLLLALASMACAPLELGTRILGASLEELLCVRRRPGAHAIDRSGL